MPENIVAILPELGVAIGQTFMMLAIGLSAALLIGGPLGILLFLLGPGQSLANRPAFLILNWLVNTVRSFPFIILLVALVPFTRIVAGTSIGPMLSDSVLVCMGPTVRRTRRARHPNRSDQPSMDLQSPDGGAVGI